MTTEQFEKDLQAEMKGVEWEKKIIRDFYIRKQHLLKEKYELHISALEVYLNGYLLWV